MASSPHRALALALIALSAAVSAGLLALASTRLAALWFLPLDAEGLDVATAPASSTPVTARTPRNSDPILRRNIFDSKTGDLLAVATAAEGEADGSEDEAPEEWDPSQPLTPCQGSLRLVGSLVNTSNPDRSVAAITGSGGAAEVYYVSGEVDGRAIRAVLVSSVVLQGSSGPPCRLAMFDPSRTPTQPQTATATPTVRTGRADANQDTEALDEGISKVSDTQYTIQRSLVDSLLEDQAGLMKLARVIPHQENGRTMGVKLYGIRRNSVLGRLGIQNGDMLRTINGFDMADATGALEAFSKLRNADSLSVSLVRRGTPQTLEYAIQ